MPPRILVLLVLLLAGCTGKPKEFSRGEPIPLGPYSIAVAARSTESSARGSSQTLVVHLRTTGVNVREDTGKFFVMFSGHMRVIDGQGNQYGALPLTLQYFRSHSSSSMETPSRVPTFLDPGDPQTNWQNWVAVARVPITGRQFRFYIENPGAKPGQARAAVVTLDR
jgi:hypothetical protein